jgi:hypothetical protein
MSEYYREEWWLQVGLHSFVAFRRLTALFSHMTCKKCKYEFCWVCMGTISIHLNIYIFLISVSIGPWAEHGTAWYSCNRYDDKSGVDARDAQSKSRASLERYLHVRKFPILCYE